ncbi:MAG: cobalt transporter CbiM [Holophaga sp.]|nr:cobalt transporter CbiM [Holophaga sp.]
MHIPDNYLSPATCAVMGAIMVPAWTISARQVKKLPTAKIPMLGIGSAFAFLIMMFNIPVPGGTTAHAIGGTLMAVLLGPWAACIAVSVALLIQCLLFGDGGVLAFGANCFNMAFVTPFLGYFIYTFLRSRVRSEHGGLVSLGVASYLALAMAALCAAIELGLQPALARDAAGLPMYCPYPLVISIPAMLIPHLAVVGFVEVFFTVGVFSFIRRVSPGSVYEGARTKIHLIYGLLVALVCLSPLGLLAPGSAWGEWGAEEIQHVMTGGHSLGFVPARIANGFRLHAAFSDYAVPGLPEWLGYVLSAITGGAALLILFKLLGLLKHPHSVMGEGGVKKINTALVNVTSDNNKFIKS